MSNLLINIKELISFYIQVNYDEYLKEKKIKFIPEDQIKTVINNMFDAKLEHMIVFVKNALKDILKDEYPDESKIDLLFTEILDDKDYCINKLFIEIKIYQEKNK
tara:strand:+ start:235 stop:549 length:315 start_codon:yes stop_codon:yes gene_type:complete